MTQRKYDSFTILYFSRAFEVKNSFFSKVLYLDIQPLCSIQSIYPMPLGHGDEAISWAQDAALGRDVSGTGSGAADQTSDSHMTSKKNVNDLIKRITPVTATPNMTSNETIINGLTYITSGIDPPLGVEFHHEPYTAFQNISTYPNYSWTFEVPEQSWIQLKYAIPLSKEGFYIISCSETYNGVISSWKVQASNEGIVFDHIVPPNTTPFINGKLHNYTFPISSKYAYWRFHMISMIIAENAGISMLRWIPTLPDIFLPRNALSVIYLDYCPMRITGVSKRTRVWPPRVQAQNLVNAVQPEFKAFKGDGSEFQC